MVQCTRAVAVCGRSARSSCRPHLDCRRSKRRPLCQFPVERRSFAAATATRSTTIGAPSGDKRGDLRSAPTRSALADRRLERLRANGGVDARLAVKGWWAPPAGAMSWAAHPGGTSL